jgi:hypothetical protein
MTSKEIEELAGHRQVPAWVVKLVADAVAIEREACLEACRMYVDLNEPPDGFQNGVECCIAVITHKDDPDVMARIKARGQHD